MEIKILGSGCANCKKLEKNAQEAIQQLQKDISITKVQDIREIMKYGVIRTPAIVINEKVKMSGKVCTVEEIKQYIEEE
ncbi:thioredoxin family protein [Pectinatus frisingensis]|uniref:thioredoxin family protein n=1 Tax=Pectinatus frisingensis TaxID=865 RepID=UPI0018C5BB0C|nr:thioredoxin family protein [Pectinatus frisingensis]